MKYSDYIKNNYRDLIFYTLLLFIFLLAIIIRVKVYVVNRSFWMDEAALALNIIDIPLSECFHHFAYKQFAPPLFMILSKVLTIIINSANEMVLRFIPFLSSIISIFVFYIFSKQFLTNKISIIIINYVFAINRILIYYSQEFKPYESDVLFAMLAILILSKIDFNKLSNLQIGILFLCSCIFANLSLPFVFIFASWTIYTLINIKKENIKKLLFFLLLILISSLLYVFLYLMNEKISLISVYWDKYFLKLNLQSVLLLLHDNFKYYFEPNNFILFPVILSILGFITFLKLMNKNNFILVFTIIFSLLASVCKVYPVYERSSLFLIPIVLILMMKPFDFVKSYWLKFLVLVLVYFSIYKYDFKFVNEYRNPNIFVRCGSRQVMVYVKEHYDNSCKVVYNSASIKEFLYYSKLLKFTELGNKYIVTQLPVYSKDLYFNTLNSLPKGTYIFVVNYDFEKSSPISEFLNEWTSNKKIIWKYQKYNSFCLKVKL